MEYLVEEAVKQAVHPGGGTARFRFSIRLDPVRRGVQTPGRFSSGSSGMSSPAERKFDPQIYKMEE